MVKVIALIKSTSDLSRAEFLRRWRDEHPAYVWRLPGLRKYTQNPAVEHRKQWPYDGAAELWFDSVSDVSAAFRDPAADAMRQHEATFIGELAWFLADEHEVGRDEDGR